MRTAQIDLPYFGDCLETVLSCETCHFRHADFMILSQKEPTRHAFKVENTDDLDVRVVRANSCTIRVPEVGFLAEPTAQSEAFVSNVQGIIERIRRVLLTARTIYADEPESVKVAEERLAQLARIEAGESPMTVILDDPFGNSAVLDDRSETRRLTDAEVEELETGVIVFDQSEIAEP